MRFSKQRTPHRYQPVSDSQNRRIVSTTYVIRVAKNSPLPTGTVQVVKSLSADTCVIKGAISVAWDVALSTTNKPPARKTRLMSGHHPTYSERFESSLWAVRNGGIVFLTECL